jgi:hypothetical protein
MGDLEDEASSSESLGMQQGVVVRTEPMQICDYQRILHPFKRSKCPSDGLWEIKPGEVEPQEEATMMVKDRNKYVEELELNPLVTTKKQKLFPFSTRIYPGFADLLFHRDDDCLAFHMGQTRMKAAQGIYIQQAWIHHHRESAVFGSEEANVIEKLSSSESIGSDGPKLKPPCPWTAVHLLPKGLESKDGSCLYLLCLGDEAGRLDLYNLEDRGKLLFRGLFHHRAIVQILTVQLPADGDIDSHIWLLLIHDDGLITIIYLNIESLKGLGSYIPATDSGLFIFGESPDSLPFIVSQCSIFDVELETGSEFQKQNCIVHHSSIVNVTFTNATDPGIIEWACSIMSSYTPKKAKSESPLFTLHSINIRTILSLEHNGSSVSQSASSWWIPASIQNVAQKFLSFPDDSNQETQYDARKKMFVELECITVVPQDGHRVIESINPIPVHGTFRPDSLVAMPDNLGRILLLELVSNCIIFIWKGYRDSICQWVYDDSTTDLLYLAIFSPSRPRQCDLWKLPTRTGNKDHENSPLPTLSKSISVKDNEILLNYVHQNNIVLGQTAKDQVPDRLVFLHRVKGHVRYVYLKDLDLV